MMCGSKYDWGRFDEDSQEWEFPRYIRGGQPTRESELNPERWYGSPIIVLMRSARIWARTLRVRSPEAQEAIRAAVLAGFEEELRRE